MTAPHEPAYAAIAHTRLADAVQASKTGAQKLAETNALVSIAASLRQLAQAEEAALEITREGWAQNAADARKAAASREQTLARLTQQNAKLAMLEKALAPQPIPAELSSAGCCHCQCDPLPDAAGDQS